MTAPQIACIIPTHGRDAELRRALESVVQQTVPPQLIVVVDDLGSPATRQLVESTSSATAVRYLDSSAEIRKGASSSRNAGAHALPDDVRVLAFLDDDDRWQPRFLELCLAELTDPAVSLVAAWGSLEVAGTVVSAAWSAAAGLSAQQVVARNPGVTGSNFVIRREAFAEVGGFDPQLRVYNDLDFFVRFLETGRHYAVVRDRLVIQSGDGADHLSSRSRRRALGIQSYVDKHRAKLSRSQLRRLQRDRHLAMRFAGQKPHLRLYHFLMMWSRSSPEQLTAVIAQRLRGHSRMYG